MKTIGEIIRAKREEVGFLLRQLAALIDIDQAILSKIERNERQPTKVQIIKIAEILNLDKEDLLIQFLSDKIVHELANEDCAFKVLEIAQEKVNNLKLNHENLSK